MENKNWLFSLLLGVLFIALGIFLIILEAPGLGIIELIFGIPLFCVSIGRLKKEIWTPLPNARKERIIRYTKAIGIISVILTFSALIFIPSYSSAAELDEYIESVIDNPINENSYESFIRCDERIQSCFPVEKILLKNLDEFNDYKHKQEMYIENYANTLSSKIENWKLPSSITSYSHYSSLSSQINSMLVDEDNAFGQLIIEKVPNYNKVAQHQKDFKKLLSQYKVACSSCGGDGRVSCEYCSGQGKNLVTWYSEGDWGYTSYSNYTCKRCNGRGSSSCGRCEGGYNYSFD